MTRQVDAADREGAAAPRVLVTRTPARSAELVEGLTGKGFAPVVSPLSEAQAVSGRAGSDAFGLLSGGPYDVVTFTSANGVWAADILTREHSARSLGELFGHARVWCVGDATRAAAMSSGLTVRNPPRENSAAGMLEEWTRVMGEGADQSVLCVHGEPARTELVDGLRDRGHRVREATVYEQVPFPAARPLLEGQTDQPCPAPVLGREATSKCLRAEGPDAIDAVVATSPRLLETLAGLGPIRVPVICIGRTTERTARELGLEAIRSPGTSAAHLTDTVSRVFGYDEHQTTHTS
ncbi:MAG: uroporphyrinogen-III synthase [Kocuria sp.]|nr:uroporphyrinogen-III synthase [Kocuria sp.]MDN5654926.1 uroporphyrinogen-III synthase [Kocuria sp.]